jgi:hypothetical protein
MANIAVLKRPLLTAVTTATAGNAVGGTIDRKTYGASGTTSSGTGAATVVIEGSMNSGASWDTIGTISLTLGTTVTSDSFTSADCFEQVRARVSAISGTGASVDAAVGY